MLEKMNQMFTGLRPLCEDELKYESKGSIGKNLNLWVNASHNMTVINNKNNRAIERCFSLEVVLIRTS